MTFPLAHRLLAIAPFRVMEVIKRAHELEQAGRSVIHMGIGEPDFPTAEPVLKAAAHALQEGATRYTPAMGLPQLREAISKHYRDIFEIDVPASRIVVTAGASGALLLACAALIEPDRDVLMQVMAKVHQSKFYDHGGTKSVLNPVANIQVGAQILKDLIRRSGSVEAGLKLYVGAGNLDSDGGYAAKVMAEYGRLQAVASGKRVPTFTPTTPAQDTDGLREAKAQEDNVPTRLHQDEPA